MEMAEQRQEEINYIEELAKRYPWLNDSEVRYLLDHNSEFRTAATNLAVSFAKSLLNSTPKTSNKTLARAAVIVLQENGCDVRLLVGERR